MRTSPGATRLLSVPLALVVAAGAVTGTTAGPAAGRPAATSAAAECALGSTVVRDAMGAANWTPLTPSKWRFTPAEVILLQVGNPPAGPRRPHEYAVLRKGPEFGSVQIEAEVRIDTPVRTRTRDVVVIFGYQSPTKFYYAHLSSDNRGYAHNGIFVVNNADRVRIDDQWNGTIGARPAITDAAYHRVLVRHCAPTGTIEVFVDGAARPLMTATDFTFASGRMAFGSFDNIGRMRSLTITGTAVCRGAAATVIGTDAGEQILGTPGRDVIVALGGNDTVRAGGGHDIVCGGDGDDIVFGEDGDDALYGEAGFDELVGGPGNDTVQQD